MVPDTESQPCRQNWYIHITWEKIKSSSSYIFDEKFIPNNEVCHSTAWLQINHESAELCTMMKHYNVCISSHHILGKNVSKVYVYDNTFRALKLGRARNSGKRDGVSDVVYSSSKLDKPLKSKTKTSVRNWIREKKIKVCYGSSRRGQKRYQLFITKTGKITVFILFEILTWVNVL